MYVETSHEIEVQVEPAYIAEQSAPESGYFFFTYRVRIQNLGSAPARLMSRHWIITDGTGHVEEVRGDGVVGEQPVIEPGQFYEYMSACPLPTPTGNMRGSYHMQAADGRKVNVRIPLFFLRLPHPLH